MALYMHRQVAHCNDTACMTDVILQTDLGGWLGWCRLRGLRLRICNACQPHQVALEESLQLCCFCCSALAEKLQGAFDESLIVFQVLHVSIKPLRPAAWQQCAYMQLSHGVRN